MKLAVYTDTPARMSDLARDLAEIRDLGYDHLGLCVPMSHAVHRLRWVETAVQVAHGLGLSVALIPWSVGPCSGEGAAGGLGDRDPAELGVWLRAVAWSGADAVLWDELRPLLAVHDGLLDRLVAQARQWGLESWANLADDDPSLVRTGIARVGVSAYLWPPYRRSVAVVADAAARQLGNLAAGGARPFVFVQAWGLEAGRHDDVVALVAALRAGGLEDFAVWSFGGSAAVSSKASAEPERCWRAVSNAVCAA